MQGRRPSRAAQARRALTGWELPARAPPAARSTTPSRCAASSASTSASASPPATCSPAQGRLRAAATHRPACLHKHPLHRRQPHSAPRTSSGHCSATGSARAATGAARSGLASAAACCCAACSALEHSVVRARTLAVKWHSAAVKEGRSRGACSQSTDMVLKPCPPRRVSLLKRLFSWAQSKHWLIALQPYPTIRSRCRQLASRGSARAALRRTRAQRGAVMRRIPNDDAERLRTVHNEKYLLMGVRALGAASNALLGRAHCARPACGARQALPSAVDRPVQVDAGALASQVAERHAREAGVAQRDRRASGPPKTYSLGDAHLARVSLGLLMFDGKKASLGSSSVTCLKAGPGEPLRHRAVPRGAPSVTQQTAWLTLDGSLGLAQTHLLMHVQSVHPRARSTQPACRAGARRSRHSRRRQRQQWRLPPRPLSAAQPRPLCWTRNSGRRLRRTRARWRRERRCAAGLGAPLDVAHIVTTAGAHSSPSSRGCGVRRRALCAY